LAIEEGGLYKGEAVGVKVEGGRWVKWGEYEEREGEEWKEDTAVESLVLTKAEFLFSSIAIWSYRPCP
jgi:hypothetical protein